MQLLMEKPGYYSNSPETTSLYLDMSKLVNKGTGDVNKCHLYGGKC